MMKHTPNQKGFTLIELLIVIGILSILASVAIPAYLRFFGQGEEEANLTELSNIQSAMDAMLAQNDISFIEERSAPGTIDFSKLPVGSSIEPEPLYPF